MTKLSPSSHQRQLVGKGTAQKDKGTNRRMLDYPVTTCMVIAVHMAVARDVFDYVFICCPFSHDISWMRSGTCLSQLLRVSLLLFYLNTYSLFNGEKVTL